MTDETKNSPNWAEDRDAVRQRAQQAKDSVEAHMESIYNRSLDEIRSHPPAHPPSQKGLNVYADHLAEKVMSEDERELYGDMKLETEQEMDEYDHQLNDIRSNFDTTPDAAEKYEQLLEEREQLIEDTHHSRGICTPLERQMAALEAVRQHNLEREDVISRDAERTASPQNHKDSIYQRAKDYLDENPPAEQPEDAVIARKRKAAERNGMDGRAQIAIEDARAKNTVQKVLTEDEARRYEAIAEELNPQLAEKDQELVPLTMRRCEEELNSYELDRYDGLLQEREQLTDDAHYSRGLCTPEEAREAAAEALREHERERAKIRPELVQRHDLDNGATFSHYQVSEADLSRPDYPGPTPADDRIHEHLAKGQHPASDPELTNRFRYVSQEFGNQTSNGTQIPQDFRKQLRQRENDRLAEFAAENHGPAVAPPEGSRGAGRHVASIRTHGADHHVIQAQDSERTIVVDGRDQPRPQPGAKVQVSVERDSNGDLSTKIEASRTKDASQGFEL